MDFCFVNDEAPEENKKLDKKSQLIIYASKSLLTDSNCIGPGIGSKFLKRI